MVYVKACSIPVDQADVCPPESTVVIQVDQSLFSGEKIPDLDPGQVAAVFGSGLLMVIFCFIVARAIGSVLSVMRQYR